MLVKYISDMEGIYSCVHKTKSFNIILLSETKISSLSTVEAYMSQLAGTNVSDKCNLIEVKILSSLKDICIHTLSLFEIGATHDLLTSILPKIFQPSNPTFSEDTFISSPSVSNVGGASKLLVIITVSEISFSTQLSISTISPFL